MMLGDRTQQLKLANWLMHAKKSLIDYHVQLAQSEGTCYLITSPSTLEQNTHLRLSTHGQIQLSMHYVRGCADKSHALGRKYLV
jgi:hypothetical protein